MFAQPPVHRGNDHSVLLGKIFNPLPTAVKLLDKHFNLFGGPVDLSGLFLIAIHAPMVAAKPAQR